MIVEITLYQAAIVLYLVGTVTSLLLGKAYRGLSIRLSAFLSITASTSAFMSSLYTILNHHQFFLQVPLQIPLGHMHLSVDPLSAFFILMIALLSIPVSLYSIGYLQREYSEKSVGLFGALYNLFLLSMILVVSAADGFLFMLLWECMTVISFGFVVFDTQNVDSQKAGFQYLLMTHVGSALLLLFFMIMALYSGSFDFTSFYHLGQHLPSGLKLALFLMMLIGFGSKAGIIPLHVWLPEAHPAAPSHISALMSGVMIKTAIYGILRYTFDFLTPFPYWWGLIVIGIALVSAFLGIIYASVESDLKRLLAYSSIENMGIILLPTGLAMTFWGLGEYSLATLSLVAGLFHTVNHSVFKGLLFLGSGAITSASHTRDLEKLGGLIKCMPQTALFFLIGALSISAIPPLNGFFSEWMIFQSLLLSFHLKSEGIRIVAPLAAAILGLIGAIAAMTFVKAFSTGFLALPRSAHAKHATEVSWSMRTGMGILALLCIVLGLTPSMTLPHLLQISQHVIGAADKPAIAFLNNGTIQVGLAPHVAFASIAPCWLFVLLIGLLPLGFLLARILGGQTAVRKEWTWSCGVTPSPEFEYTPTGFSQPIERVFSWFHTPDDVYHKYIYLPLVRLLVKCSYGISPIQSGNLQLYLGYIFATLMICLVWWR